ncbi:MAG: MotA/TolQ/ExbB proton channel family protein [Pseudobdellovibrionaceae bacterium]|nr:MotA/TolQ/ExbB proton channel family protein [Pseudobdellovibrionaceae bacterium]
MLNFALHRIFRIVTGLSLIFLLGLGSSAALLAQDTPAKDASNAASGEVGEETATQVADFGSHSMISQAWRSGLVVFTVLVVLIAFSIISWAVFIWKMVVLRKHTATSEAFIKNFWESRSLNDLNSRLGEYPYSPAKEVFRTGYAELVRGSQLKENATQPQLAINAAIENLNRSLGKAKRVERKKLESYLSLLAIIASSAPFIGLFGTVWGIMGSFEGIARTGSASLAAVAPGISEALIATAFGLLAAIPAVIGFNAAQGRIRNLVGSLDGFIADFLNIVGRYLVSEKKGGPATTQSPL